uniref:ABC-type transporter, integral membrane subunit n=1 Tax=uncultured bacterium contig00091 TaxID=1181562 RepID=A0A806JZQ4_9BACT|nr:ABC-type transporter, integral membrane subunit [uncultured bacterium contig00091]
MLLFILFYNKLFAITFDETFAKTGGVKAGVYNMIIALLTALTIVLGMRLMGALLISSLIIFPALSSMRLFKKFKSVTICSAVISIVCFFIGVVISYLKATPTGASVVFVNIIVFALFWGFDVLRRSPLAKRFAAAVAAAAVVLVVLSVPVSCKDSGDIIQIRERYFTEQVNNVYLNPDEFMGKTIKLEGIFKMEVNEYWPDPYYLVYRNGPGCCGVDGVVGFEVSWDNNSKRQYPKDNSWVEAVGIVSKYGEDEGFQFLYLDLRSLTVKDKRGEENVGGL